jgi:hypothetical protein
MKVRILKVEVIKHEVTGAGSFLRDILEMPFVRVLYECQGRRGEVVVPAGLGRERVLLAIRDKIASEERKPMVWDERIIKDLREMEGKEFELPPTPQEHLENALRELVKALRECFVEKGGYRR